MGVDTALFALGHKVAHVGSGGVTGLCRSRYQQRSGQHGIKQTANIPASAESADDNPLPRPGATQVPPPTNRPSHDGC